VRPALRAHIKNTHQFQACPANDASRGVPPWGKGMAESCKQRRKMRYRVEVDIEATDPECVIRLRARTSTLSAYGCGIGTLSSFPQGATVRVRLMHRNAEMVALGRVVYSRPDLGTGIAFITMESSDECILREWIDEFMDLQTPRQ
jgi:hypothetical protein